MDITTMNWYESLIADCRAIITEAVFTSRWTLIEGYHDLGERIVNDKDYQKNSRGNGAILSRVSKSLGVHERDLHRAIQFYKKYPSLDALPDGKNISWHKIVNNLLPDSKEEKPTQPDPLIQCPGCGLYFDPKGKL